MRTADQPIRLSLFAPNGRMGKAIAAAVEADPGFAIDQEHGDVLVDFSAPDALQASLDRAVSASVPILVGTTGLRDEHQLLIDEAAKSIAVVLDDSDEYPAIEADTADFAYARPQRMSEDVLTGYDDAALDGFAARACEWRKRGDSYIFMINGAKVRAPAAALALRDRLGV